MLTKDLLRVSRAGGGYRPRFAGPGQEALAGRVLGVFQGHVGEERRELDAALEALEREGEFKLVRGFAKLLEREATFAVESPLPPERARKAAFAAAEPAGVVTDDERAAALADAGGSLGATPEEVGESLYADRPEREFLRDVSAVWSPPELLAQYNLSLAQTALFDATRVEVRSSDPRGLVSAVKRLGLLYEMYWEGEDQVVELTGPDALFRRTRRYGTRFARLLRSVVRAREWELEATIDDKGIERTMRLSESDPLRVPEADPVAEVSYDSGVEREFGARFEALDLDWELVREPAFLEAGERVMVPDFAFEYEHADCTVYFEVMGFWTPEYVEKKLAQLAGTEERLLVAVDESLGAGEEIAARDHRAIPYSGSVRVKEVVDALREYEADLVAEAAARLPDGLVPEDDVLTLSELATRHGVSEDAVEDKAFPEHELVGRTLVRPAVLDSLGEDIGAGIDLEAAEAACEKRGIGDIAAVLSKLGYRVAWEGLSGGTVEEK
jgi:predicted nuclease of restriction endonuclease-like RecB superfamily